MTCGIMDKLISFWILLDIISEIRCYSETETVITGSPYHGTVGVFNVPETSGYFLDDSAHIFILENVAIEGAVSLTFDTFNLHHSSFLTVRDTKYGGALGRVISRYSSHDPPPSTLVSSSCCLRVEYYTGCCEEKTYFKGLKISYRFIKAQKGKGRRSFCPEQRFPRYLCNGECVPIDWPCPCPKYGQYKCDDGFCVDKDKVCNGVADCSNETDELNCQRIVRNTIIPYSERLDAMYALAPIVTTACLAVTVACFLVCLVRCLEKSTREFCIDVVLHSRKIKGFGHRKSCQL